MNTLERILFVGNNPDIEDLVVRQTLQPLGYEVQKAPDVSLAIVEAARSAPDLVVADMNLPGLSGKDLLVAFNSQGLKVPVIVIANKGEEQKVIQAFRLGATDYLLWPVREAEVVAAVERAVKQVRESRTRESLNEQLTDTHEELKQRVRELTTIFAVGKAVISITDHRVLLDQIVEGMLYTAKADYSWLLLREQQNRTFLLAAHRHLPEAWANRMGQQLDDGISSLVALSGETLAINGEPLKRFKVASLGQSAMVVPLKVQKEVVGLLVLVRSENKPFDKNMQSLLEAVTDYAAISLVNARLIHAVQLTADAARLGEQKERKELQSLKAAIRSLLEPVIYPLEMMLDGKMGKLAHEQKRALNVIQDVLVKVESLVASDQTSKPSEEK